jgi:MSHA biogenesis protein MshJ
MSPRVRLQALAERVNGFSLRERGLLFLAILAAVFLLWDWAVMGPINERQKRTQDQLEQVRDRVTNLNESIQSMVQQRQRDPDAELTARRDALQEEVAKLETRINELHSGVSSPDRAVRVLARLLADRPDLSVVRLENLPSTPLVGTELANGGQAGIFVHRVRLVVESDFEGILGYMGLIENLPEGVYWESLKLEVPEWPRNRVEMVLYSLALNDGWLGI